MSSIGLRDCLNDFVDRIGEKKIVEEFCNGKLGRTKRCLIFHGRRDVGITFFLKHLEQRFKKNLFTVYADCKSSDPEIIFRSFFEQVEQRPLLHRHALSPWKEIGPLLFQMLGAFISYIPIFGRPAAIIVGNALPKIAFTPYPSVSSERFSRLVTSRRWKKPILFLVDNAQEIKPQSLNLLRTAFSDDYNHVKFILCFVGGEGEGKQELFDFEARLVALGIDVERRGFPSPDDCFITELATSISVDLTQKERHKILLQSKHKISQIIKTLLTGVISPSMQFSPVETEVLRYLFVASQALQEADLIALIIRSPRLAYSDKESINAIEGLVSAGWLQRFRHHLVRSVELSVGAIPHIKDSIQNVAFDLVASQELYSYFSDVQQSHSLRHAQHAYGALLYNLAKLVDHGSVPRHAFNLVRISLAQGDLDAGRQYIDDALGERRTYSHSDLYTLLAFHVSIQEYDEAAKILQPLVKYFADDRTLRIIHAVVENRLRHHDVANQEIARLLQDTTTEEEWALLTSYKVAGLLHDGRQRDAASEFEAHRGKFLCARNRAYALRNCAAIYFWEPTLDIQRAKDILEDAIDIFTQQQDRYGYLTTLNNKGALNKCIDDMPAASALPIFQEVFDKLSVYGVHHLEEVGANLGICLLLSGQLDMASVHLRKVISIATYDFPRILMESALAFVDAMRSDISSAQARMKHLTDEASKVGLSEAVYRANVNAAAIEALAGNETQFNDYINAASRSNYWGGRDSLNRLIEDAASGKIRPDVLPYYFSYDFFQYWSQNPLAIFSPSSLPYEAI